MEFTDEKKAFLIGAGFDKMFGMPTWTEMIYLFRDYLVLVCKKDPLILKRKLDNILKQENSQIRKFEMLLNMAKYHILDEKEPQLFFRRILDSNLYTEKEELKESAFEKMSHSKDLFITTNFSNTFDIKGWKWEYNNSQLSAMTYVPLHGNAFIKSSKDKFLKVISLESDYLHSEYLARMDKLNNLLKDFDVQEIHIYGYSINDIDILKEIIRSKDKKIYMYLAYDDVEWRDVQINYLKYLFEKFKIDIYFVLPESNFNNLAKSNRELNIIVQKPYEKLMEKFIKATQKSAKIEKTNDWVADINEYYEKKGGANVNGS